MRPCSYMRSSLCPGGDPLFFVLSHHFTEIRKKKGIDTKTNRRTGHCTLTTATRRSTYTNKPTPLLRDTGEGCGQVRERGGNGEGKITPTRHLLHPFPSFLSLRFFLFARITSSFHDKQLTDTPPREEITGTEE